MTIENTIKNAETILADFYAQRAEIEAVETPKGSYVLRWFYAGSSLYVGRQAGSFGATGFARVSIFDDRAGAEAFLGRTGIKNGHGHPKPVLASIAKEGALADLAGVIDTMSTIVDAKREA